MGNFIIHAKGWGLMASISCVGKSKQSLETQLVNAVRSGDVEMVKLTLNKGANVNIVLSTGETVIGTAAQAGNVAILQLLLNYDGSSCSRSGKTNKGSNSECQMTTESSAIGKKSSSKYCCVDNKRTVNFRNSESIHKNNLGYFVMIHDEEIGGIVEHEDSNGVVDENENESLCLDDTQTPDGMEELEWDVEVKDEGSGCEGEEDVWACQYRWYADILDKTGCVSAQVSNFKCEVNLQDVHGCSALHYAASQGHLEALQLLIQAGCQVDLYDADNQTPLQLAAAKDHVEVAELLISCGAQVNRKNSEKISALHFAAARGFQEMVKLLLMKGANVNSLDSSDRTPLYLAVSRDQIEVVGILIDYGAKVNIEEIHGYTPICEAVWRKNVQMAGILLNAGAKLTHSHHLLKYAVLHRHHQMAELLLSCGALPNARDDAGETPLILASRTSQVHMAQLLLKHGAKANLVNIVSGCTPLLAAVQFVNHLPSFENLVIVLQSHGADLDHCWDYTPLTRLIILNKFSMAAFLIRMGADVNKWTKMGDYVFDNLVLARNFKQFTLVQMLVFSGYDLTSKKLEELPAPKRKSIDSWLHHMKTNPMQLIDLCRLQIRKQVGSRIRSVTDALEIPNLLKRFLNLEEFQVNEPNSTPHISAIVPSLFS